MKQPKYKIGDLVRVLGDAPNKRGTPHLKFSEVKPGIQRIVIVEAIHDEWMYRFTKDPRHDVGIMEDRLSLALDPIDMLILEIL